MPEIFDSDFIRGYFDGNGSVTYTTCPTMSLVSGSESMINSLNNKISKHVFIELKSKNTLSPIIKGIGSFAIGYSGKNAGRILKFIYENSTSLLRLDRKYEKAIELGLYLNNI